MSAHESGSKPKLNLPGAQSASAPKVLRAVNLPGAKLLTPASQDQPRVAMTASGAMKILRPEAVPMAVPVREDDGE